MNLQPRLNFELNIELDKWTCNSEEFHSSVVRVHPALAEGENLESEAKKSFTDNYVTDYYSIHQKELNDAIKLWGETKSIKAFVTKYFNTENTNL